MNQTKQLNTSRLKGFIFRGVLLAVLSLAIGAVFSASRLTESQDAHAAGTTYQCPLHSIIQEEHAGECPICGVALKAKSEPILEEISALGIIAIDPVVVQNMGVRVAPAALGTLSRSIRTIGEVDVAEDQVSVVNLRYSGWIERIYVDETGQSVKRGDPLFSIYSPELYAGQKEYLLAVNSSGADSALANAAADKLRLLGLGKATLAAVIKKQNVKRTVSVRAPREGYILHKNVLQGARVNAGTDLYRIGGLQQIWVNTEVYEFDAPWVRLGQKATMELSFQRGKVYEGKVDYIYPTLNKRSRTLTVRLEFPNPGIDLKPGMFTTVHIEAQKKSDALIIPTEAVIHSGERQLVFVAKGLGKYEPREIVTGLLGDGHVTEVLSGVKKGESIVTSGQFLLDSESQLKEAVQKLLDARLQAKGGPPPNTVGKGNESAKEGDSYWTCSMHPQVVQDKPGTCPICHMDLVEKHRSHQH